MKRRLELMPELLPAPTKVGTSAVRARTMARLRVMAAVGASIAAACGGKSESSGSGSSGGGSSSGGGTDGGLPDGTLVGKDAGYGVVDPLPPPACFEYSNPPTVSFGWSGDDAGADASATAGIYVLDVKWPQSDVAVGEVSIQNASFTVQESRQKPGVLELVLRKDQDTGFLMGTVTIQTSCAKGPTQVTVTITEDASGAKAQLHFSGGG